MFPFDNHYAIPDFIPEYQTISTDEKTDWQAQWIWDAENIQEENTWMCFFKSVNFDAVPSTLTAHISADSKYWLYINGQTVVFEGSLKRDSGRGYYDSVDIAPYFKEGDNSICVLAWYWGSEENYSYVSSGQGGFIFEAIGEDVTILSNSTRKVKKNHSYVNRFLYQPNYRLPEFSIYYDARRDMVSWMKEGYDFSSWDSATEYGVGGSGVYGKLYPRGIPMLKDYGLKDYENSADYENYVVTKNNEKITVTIP
ncbi:MAG: hypothetical protein IKB54_00630, partial [Clostridia bacterium]|nr:hypothetical protein [Clostridia bacterium]